MLDLELVKNNLTLSEILDVSLWNLGGDVVLQNNLDRSYEQLKCKKISTNYGPKYVIYAYDWEKRANLLGIFHRWETKGNLKYKINQDKLVISGRAVQVQISPTNNDLLIEGL
jgi:hypothetical protein